MSRDKYYPPFTLTPQILCLTADISEQAGRLSARPNAAIALRLRRLNHIRTIQGSLAIEGNTLSTEQITAILDGKRVIASPKEIQEVKSAVTAYDRLDKWNPNSEKDLLKAHGLMMNNLTEEAGRYRSGGVGVMSGSQVVHLAPPAARVPELMGNLMGWLKAAEHHPLIAGSVFHYEFEFIHPFSDANGRIGRLWNSAILYRWNPIFAYIPVESLIYAHQSEYYNALRQSTKNSDSSTFIEYMLQRIKEAVNEFTPQVAPEVTPQVKMLLEVLKGEMSRAELQVALGLKDAKSFRARYLIPAIENGLIEMTQPNKPNSRFQKYYTKFSSKKNNN
jgi:Fic family protein